MSDLRYHAPARHHASDPDTVPDAVLVAAAADGGRDALAALYRRHAATVFSLALRLLGDRQDAEDVLQDVFLGLPHALHRYAEAGTSTAWLRRVTARTAIARRRHRRATEVLPPDQPAPGRDPATRLDLDAAIATLPDALRAPFVLRAVEGFSHAEVAALLDISPANAMQRFSRACKRLRVSLDPGS